jgi:hypothetical protein
MTKKKKGKGKKSSEGMMVSILLWEVKKINGKG